MSEGLSARYAYRVGRVLRPHGLQGQLVIQLFRPRLAPGRGLGSILLELEGSEEEHTLRAVDWIDPLRVRARLEAVRDRDAAERLVGAYVDLDPEALPGALCDSFDELFGAEARHAETGASLGEIWSIRDNGAHPLLIIGEEELMIPCVPEFVSSPRREGEKRIVLIQPIPGLLEVNDPGA